MWKSGHGTREVNGVTTHIWTGAENRQRLSRRNRPYIARLHVVTGVVFILFSSFDKSLLRISIYWFKREDGIAQRPLSSPISAIPPSCFPLFAGPLELCVCSVNWINAYNAKTGSGWKLSARFLRVKSREMCKYWLCDWFNLEWFQKVFEQFNKMCREYDVFELKLHLKFSIKICCWKGKFQIRE